MYDKPQKKATALRLIGRNISVLLTQVNLQIDVAITGFIGFEILSGYRIFWVIVSRDLTPPITANEGVVTSESLQICLFRNVPNNHSGHFNIIPHYTSTRSVIVTVQNDRLLRNIGNMTQNIFLVTGIYVYHYIQVLKFLGR
jgi:hypothetical protein